MSVEPPTKRVGGPCGFAEGSKDRLIYSSTAAVVYTARCCCGIFLEIDTEPAEHYTHCTAVGLPAATPFCCKLHTAVFDYSSRLNIILRLYIREILRISTCCRPHDCRLIFYRPMELFDVFSENSKLIIICQRETESEY